jgi:hypothetical protein
MDRLSMKKFKYQGTTDVFMQCKIRACAQQPCGVCTGTGDPRRQLQTDLSPVEGEMFAPPVGVRVSANDQNALVFGQPVGPVPTMYQPAFVQSSSANAIVDVATGISQPFRVRSEMTLPVTAAWATQNQPALIATLRSTLNLLPTEELVILSIKAGRRLEEKSRNLQTGAVKIDFAVGVASASRASTSQSQLTQLATGNASFTSKFVQQLDSELQARGAAPVNISPLTLTFAAPTTSSSQAGAQTAQFNFASGAVVQGSAATTTNASETSSKKDGDNNMLMGALIIAIAIVFFAIYTGGQKAKAAAAPAAGQNNADLSYNAKVYADNDQQIFDDLQVQ